MMLTIFLVSLCCLILFFIYGIHAYLMDKRYRLPPGPVPLPFVGTILSMSNLNKRWIAFNDLAKEFGPIYTFYLGQFRLVILNGSEVIHEAIASQGKIFADRANTILPGFENYPTGVLFSSGKKWQVRRRFSLKALRDFGMGKIAIVDKIHDEIGFFLDEINELTFRPFNPQQLLANAVSNVICSIAFGKRFSYGDPEFVAFLTQLNSLITRPLSRNILFLAVPIIRKVFRTKQATEGLKLIKMLEEITKRSVDEHRKDFDKENIRDFPDLFISTEMSQDGLDFESFSLVMMDMFAAGTETTATALNWSLLYLSTYPDIQRRCHDAIDRAIDTDRLPTLEDRSKLVYIDAVMCEVLRHATIVPCALFHANLNDDAVVAGYEIPQKTIAVYNVWAVHHDPVYWTEPERFNPDRWIDSNGKLLTHTSHFMPFGVGPRVCLGELLARVEYFIFLVAMLQRFNFALADANVSLDDGIPGITYAPPRYKLMASKR